MLQNLGPHMEQKWAVFVGFFRQRFVVEFAGGCGVEAELN
jgi:hypothetical protein